MSTYKIELEAEAVYDALVADFDFELPEIDLDDPQYNLPYDPDSALYKPVAPITIDDLTTRVVGGTGVFDALMDAFKAHIRQEFDDSRITGSEYSKAYVAGTTAAMANAVQFLLGKDAAFWQAQSAQIAAVTGNIQMATAKMQFATARLQAANEGATYALTKARLGTESVNYGIAVYNLSTMQPAQYEQLLQQTTMVGHQIKLIDEQTESARAQTLDTRTDGQSVRGSVGKQVALYTQQITSYLRNDERSAAKIFSDTWTAMKTIDEGLTAPDCFTNDTINEVMQTVKTNNDL